MINEDFLLSTALFQEMTKEDLPMALNCLHYYQRSYDKHETVLAAGQDIRFMGLVCKGSVTVERNDRWGNRMILTQAQTGGFFGEMYAMTPGIILPVDVVAAENCTVAFFEVSRLMHHQCSYPEVVGALTRNLLKIAIRKNLQLSNRSFHTAPRSIRERVLAYLNTMSLQNRSLNFDIPFDRQQLADYLNVERTALSKELKKMQNDGLIDCWKNHFRLLVPQEDDGTVPDPDAE